MPVDRHSPFRALLTCRTEAEMKNVIADLLSSGEIARAEQRWAIAQTRIETRCSIHETREGHTASQDLVTRVFHAVDRKGSGYRLAYPRLKPEGVKVQYLQVRLTHS
jgi:uncharacterized protein YerC